MVWCIIKVLLWLNFEKSITVFEVNKSSTNWQLIPTHLANYSTTGRVSDQLSDGLMFGRLFQANKRFSAFPLDLHAYYLQYLSKDKHASVSLHGTAG